MKQSPLIITLLVTLLISSCNNSSSNEHSDTEEIELNDGQKWKVNEEMSPFILEGEKILSEFDGNDFEALALKLNDQNNSLIKSCTMDGKSHDELHKWLHPHLEMVNALSKADSDTKAQEIVSQLKKSYDTYHTYFE